MVHVAREVVWCTSPSHVWSCVPVAHSPGERVHLTVTDGPAAFEQWVKCLKSVLFAAAKEGGVGGAGWRHRVVLGTLFSAGLFGDSALMTALLHPAAVGAAPAVDAGSSPDAGAGSSGAGGAGAGGTPAPGFGVADRDEEGNTPLHIAAHSNQVGVVSLLLASGADPNAVNDEGQTALFVACCRGVDDVVAVLMSNGADPDVVDALGQSSLHVAMVRAMGPVGGLLFVATSVPPPAARPPTAGGPVSVLPVCACRRDEHGRRAAPILCPRVVLATWVLHRCPALLSSPPPPARTHAHTPLNPAPCPPPPRPVPMCPPSPGWCACWWPPTPALSPGWTAPTTLR